MPTFHNARFAIICECCGEALSSANWTYDDTEKCFTCYQRIQMEAALFADSALPSRLSHNPLRARQIEYWRERE